MKNLAILTPVIGANSATFIRRHIECLLPKKTVVISQRVKLEERPTWNVSCPKLILKEYKVRSGSEALPLKMLLSQAPNFPAFIKFLKSNNVGVILSQHMDYSAPWLVCARAAGFPFFIHAHGRDVAQLSKTVPKKEIRMLFNEATGIIVVSHYMKRKLCKMGINSTLISVIPCGVLKVSRDPVSLKSVSAKVRCIAVGRMIPKKGPLFLMEAFEKAYRQNSQLTLDWVGSGLLFDKVERFVSKRNLSGAVNLHGSLVNIKTLALLKKADIFIQHSVKDNIGHDEEGLPVSILEAMAAGLPVISTLHAGISEAVIQEQTGLLSSPGDIEAMAKNIITLANDVKLRRRFGARGQKRVNRYYTWSRERKNLLSLFEEYLC